MFQVKLKWNRTLGSTGLPWEQPASDPGLSREEHLKAETDRDLPEVLTGQERLAGLCNNQHEPGDETRRERSRGTRTSLMTLT